MNQQDLLYSLACAAMKLAMDPPLLEKLVGPAPSSPVALGPKALDFPQRDQQRLQADMPRIVHQNAQPAAAQQQQSRINEALNLAPHGSAAWTRVPLK